MATRTPTKFSAGQISRLRRDGTTTSNPSVTAERPRTDGRKGSEVYSIAVFDHGEDQEASDYASELKRETRGYANGGLVKPKVGGTATAPMCNHKKR